MKTATIYILSDPRTDEVRYIGATVQKLTHRLRKHVKYEGLDAKSVWIQSLVHEDVSPVITEIEVVPAEEKGAAEQRWVAFYRQQGADLTNSTEGGSGSPGFRHSPQARAAMSQSRKGRPSPMKGRTHSPESRELLRQAAQRQFQDPAQREAVSRVHKGKTLSEDHRRAVSEANTKRWTEWRARKASASNGE